MPKRPARISIGIVGSRRRNTLADRRIVFDIVRRALEHFQDVTVVSGGAKGPDTFAENAADFFGTKKIIHCVPPAKDKHDFREKAYARNRDIVIDSDKVFALVHPDRKGGTENTIKHAEELGKPVFLVDQEGCVYLSGVDRKT